MGEAIADDVSGDVDTFFDFSNNSKFTKLFDCSQLKL